jgi:hypothetical protein
VRFSQRSELPARRGQASREYSAGLDQARALPPSHHFNTRSARSVFQRLAAPTERPSARWLHRTMSMSVYRLVLSAGKDHFSPATKFSLGAG